MRPETKRQAQHHFIRRWPKTRRDDRQPETKTVTIEFTVTPAMRMSARPDHDHPYGHAFSEAIKACPAGYEVLSVEEPIQTMMTGVSPSYVVEACYRRVKKTRGDHR